MTRTETTIFIHRDEPLRAEVIDTASDSCCVRIMSDELELIAIQFIRCAEMGRKLAEVINEQN